MKRLLLVIFLASFGAIWWFLRPALVPNRPSSILVTPTPTPIVIGYPLNLNQKEYRYNYYVMKTDDTLTLIDNYENKKYSSSLLENKTCSKIFNGGFYDASSEPLGLVIINGVKRAPYRDSELFNGFLTHISGVFTLTTTLPDIPEIENAIQSGPMLMIYGKAQALSLNRDKPSRRTLVVQTKTGQLIFMVVYDASIAYGGPYLSDLPEAVIRICAIENLNCSHALNLDGGSASVFYTSPDIYFREIVPVGTLVCLTN